MINNFDFSHFKETEHMLEWLHANAEDSIKLTFSDSLNNQVPGSQLLGLHVTAKPEWLTGALPRNEDETKAILVRIGLAFSFELSVKTPEGDTHDLKGVYSWVSVNMDDPDNISQRTWTDLDGELSEFGSDGLLKERVYFEVSENDI